MIIQQIFQAFKDGKTLVFPSETAARSQLIAYLKENPGTAVCTDHSLSYDTYKTSRISLPEGKNQAEKYHRFLFSSGFFNSEKAKNLKYFLTDSTTDVANALPGFNQIPDNPEASANLKHDVRIILDEYEKFSDRCSVYEENYLNPNYSDTDTEYVFVFPETYQDVQALGLKGRKISASEITLPTLKIFPNSLAEIRDTVRKVFDLLCNGTKPSQIALTVTDMESYAPVLESEASKRGFKFAFMKGKPLASYAGGRMFNAIKAIQEENYSIASVKNLLLDPVYPFRDKGKINRLVGLLIICKLEDGGPEGCKIKEKLRICKEEDAAESLDYFIRLSSFIHGICTACDADSLRRALKGFQDTFFEPTSWDSTGIELDRKVFERCMEMLDNLEEVISLSGCETERLYSLFCTILNNVTYMDQDKEGIKVYEYPLSCGININHHFILGLDDDSVRVPINRLPFSGKISDGSSIQLGDGIIKAYCFNPQGLEISCALESFTNSCMAPSLFTENGKTKIIDIICEDSFSAEEKLWQNNVTAEQIKIKPLKVQTMSQEILTTGKRVEHPIAQKPYSISATSLNTFIKCPYKWMCKYLLNLEEQDYMPQMSDYLELGNILHETLEEWFMTVRTIENARSQESQELLNSIFERKTVQYANTYKAPLNIYIKHILEKYKGTLGKIVDEKLKSQVLDDCTFNEKEKHFNISLEKYSINGSIDCIFTTPEGNFVVIDFKTNEVDKNSQQVAFYAKALETPVRGAFYSIGKKTFTQIFSNPVELQQVMDDCDNWLEKYVNNMDNNEFEATPDDENCVRCEFSRICRKRYVIK